MDENAPAPRDDAPAPAWPSAYALRRRTDVLAARRAELRREEARRIREAADTDAALRLADRVADALETLNRDLFRRVLDVMEEKLSRALVEVLEQPLAFRAELRWKNDQAAVEFHLERDGRREDPYHGQGGSVANVLSVGLRLFALATLDPARHRRFLVLDEQDCWLEPARVPALARLVADAGRALGFQVLMISHHDRAVFEEFADRVYVFTPEPDGTVSVAPADPS